MWNEIFEKAQNDALGAFHSCVPTPMIVGQAESLFSNKIVPGTEEFVSDGVCGFAWVTVKPARGPFVKFLKTKGIGRKGTYGGYQISFYEICPTQRGSQSMERKEAACREFVTRIKMYDPEMRIWMESRMD